MDETDLRVNSKHAVKSLLGEQIGAFSLQGREIKEWFGGKWGRRINADRRNRAPSEHQTRCEITSRGSRRVFSSEELFLSAGNKGMVLGANGGGTEGIHLS
ncbi:hypothetical protein CEXT_350641 [Caerostris extrusa]|uniref:Uncharacterized protein n=1 Tax=Caerostris extrusa TaxID=172846 RepID=A0AAV4X302_CAEEX|nr:hypothetical protein CEXT_350641 [Caerostris extrusa]